MAFLDMHETYDRYDNFSEKGGDTDRDGVISMFEYSPVGVASGSFSYTFSKNIFPNGVGAELTRMDQRPYRPLIYVPVYSRYAREVASGWTGSNPRPNDASVGINDPLNQLAFPPPQYDAYVLMSIGPDGTTAGMVYDGNTAQFNLNNYGLDLDVVGDRKLAYHILGHAIYFMATRDADNNGELDFDYLARTRRGEAGNKNNNLPDPTRPYGGGPLIFKSK
jgi:hypothetical protein